MKKRLRKKLGVGEFEELVFEFYGEVEDADSQAIFDKFVEALNAAEFTCEGAWDEQGIDLLVYTGLKNSDNEARKVQFMSLVEKIEGLKEAKAGEIF